MNDEPDYNLLYETAENQAGYFTATQARRHGFSWERLSDNVKRGRFLRIVRGVYRLAHFPGSAHEDLFVAWLRTGPHSVISHESALTLYNLSDVLPGKSRDHPPHGLRRRPGLRLHTNQLRPEDVTNRQGLPVTTVARTIADVAIAGLAKEHIAQAIIEALNRGLTTVDELATQAVYHGGRARETIQEALSEGFSHEI
ncbi:MAG: hypothetical protein IPF56_23870 [Chloroflexi bacterium]|nr:hypothetical protein [Chloroflexota bacterium]